MFGETQWCNHFGSKGGTPKGGELKGGATKEGGRAQNFALLSLSCHNFPFSLGGLFVEFWWCFEAPGPSNVHVWRTKDKRQNDRKKEKEIEKNKKESHEK